MTAERSPFPSTSWRLVGVRRPDGARQALEVLVVVDTTAEVVVEAIEAAAAAHGVELERDQQDGDAWTRAQGAPE